MNRLRTPQLRAPDADSELPIASAWAYVEQVDNSLVKDRENYTELYQILEVIIALDVGSYLMYHTSQLTTYDQSTAETLMNLSSKNKKRFHEISGKEYINKNIW